MLRRIMVRSNTTTSKFKEHYQYLGNAPYETFRNYLESDRPSYIQDTQVFQPTEQIEFNRKGELILFDCNVYQHINALTMYPYCL